MSTKRLALDACVLINLCATGRTVEIATTLDVRFVVPQQVSNETFYVRLLGGPGEALIPIELEAFVAAGVLEIVDLRGEELITFVAAAARLDDGEAAALAVATHRGLVLATDDRAALRLIAAEHAGLDVLSTSQLIRHYCEQTQLPEAEAAECLIAVEKRASFVPPSSDPEAQWWGSTRAKAG